MDLYPGTSLPEIVKLEQVQRGAANTITSWSELGGEVEGAEPAGLDELWWGRSCPRHPGVQAPGRAEATLLGIFCREGTGHWGQGIPPRHQR